MSSDLAHTHRVDGPYGFCECAQLFDDAVGRWMHTLDTGALHETTIQEQAGAKSCGYTGLVMLHGALQALGGRDVWQPELLSLNAPTYYGMGVGVFNPGKSVNTLIFNSATV